MAIKRCPNCGKAVSELAQICPNCSKEIVAGEVYVKPQKEKKEFATTYTPYKFVAVLPLILAVLCCFFGVLYAEMYFGMVHVAELLGNIKNVLCSSLLPIVAAVVLLVANSSIKKDKNRMAYILLLVTTVIAVVAFGVAMYSLKFLYAGSFGYKADSLDDMIVYLQKAKVMEVWGVFTNKGTSLQTFFAGGYRFFVFWANALQPVCYLSSVIMTAILAVKKLIRK